MLTLPNLLTLSRIFAVPILVLLLWHPSRLDYALCFGLYVLMAVTDYFDGYVARAQGAVSKLGIFLDPIADKIMIAAVILMLVGTRFEDRAIITGIETRRSARNSRSPETAISRIRMISAAITAEPTMSPVTISMTITAATMILSAIGSRKMPSLETAPCARAT